MGREVATMSENTTALWTLALFDRLIEFTHSLSDVAAFQNGEMAVADIPIWLLVSRPDQQRFPKAINDHVIKLQLRSIVACFIVRRTIKQWNETLPTGYHHVSTARDH
jgi:hypothetical protein